MPRLVRADAPHHVARVVGDQQRASAIERYADGPAPHRLAVVAEKSGDDRDGVAVRSAVHQR
jgi:hypothetical protein